MTKRLAPLFLWLLLPAVIVRADDANVIERFRVAKGGDLLLIPVAVRADEHPFLIDTGANHTFIDKRFQNILGTVQRKTTAKTAAEDIDVEEYAAPPMRIGRTELKPPSKVVCVDLIGTSEAIGAKVDGVLGMDCLRSFAIQIDFEVGEVRFLKSAIGAPGEAIRLYFDRYGCPRILAAISEFETRRYMIDSGFGGSVGLQADDFQQLIGGGLISRASVQVVIQPVLAFVRSPPVSCGRLLLAERRSEI